MGHSQSGPAGGGGETVALRPQPWLLAVAGQWVLKQLPQCRFHSVVSQEQLGWS